MTELSMAWLTDIEDIDDAALLQLELMRPFNVYDFIRDPSAETLLKTMYMPTMAYLGYRGALMVTGEAGVGFWARQGARFHDYRQAARAAAPYLPLALLVATYYTVGSQVVAMPYRSVRYTSDSVDPLLQPAGS